MSPDHALATPPVPVHVELAGQLPGLKKERNVSACGTGLVGSFDGLAMIGEYDGVVRDVVWLAIAPRIAANALARSPAVSAKYACCVPPWMAMFSSVQHAEKSGSAHFTGSMWGVGD